MNQRDTLKIIKNDLIIGGMTAKELATKFGTPLYVFDQKHIEDMCETFTKSLNKYYGDGLVSYASKAFCCKEIYRIISQYNMGADVVSLGELKTALSVDFSADSLIFHGNNKSYEELNCAVKSGVKYIVIDSVFEADILNEICKQNNVKQNVLIRVNPGVEAHTHQYIQTAKIDSKFGFSITNGDAFDIIQNILSKDFLNLVGLHCHIGSQIFEKNSFCLAVDKMLSFYRVCKDKFDIEFPVLDLGGGFGIYYSGNDPKLTLKDYEEYVKVICDSVIANANKYGLQKPYLILEPGRSIVGEAGITLYTVGSVKHIKGVKDYLAIDGGMFENPRFALYQAEYSVVAPTKMDKPLTKCYSIAGKCCESGDLIAQDIKLPEISSGELLAVLSTGAYNFSMASNYNRNLIPQVVMVKDKNSRVVVKGQTIEELISRDV